MARFASLPLLLPALAAPLALCAAEATARAQGAPAPIEVTVEGQRSPVATRDPDVPSYVVHADRLQVPGQSAADVLAEVPGVQVARTGAASDLATASIRGATSAQTPVYLAGVRLNDDVTGTADLSLVPLWMLQRVEVYRGNAPADADRLGIGGAVFFEPLLPHGTRVTGGFGAGSFGELSMKVAGAFGDERGGGMVALQRQSATNDYTYTDRSGMPQLRHNADFAAYDLWSVARYPLGGGSVTVIANAFVRDQGVSSIALSQTSAARAHTERWLGAARAVVPCSSRRSDRCQVEVQTSAIATIQRFDDPYSELALGATQATTRGSRLTEQARLRYRVIDALTLGLSASEELEQLAIDRPGAQTTRDLRATTRGAAFATFQVNRILSLNGVAAIEHDATQATSSARLIEPTGRLGARLDLGHGVTLLASAGRYARVPTLGELYGISPTVLGTPTLVPETSYSADLGARFSDKIAGNPLFFEAFGFSRFASQLIYYNQDSLRAIRPHNADSARILGVEVAASADLFHHLRADLTLTLLDPRDTAGSDPTLLPYQARIVTAPHVEVYQGAIEALRLDRAALSGRLSYRGARIVDTSGREPPLPAVTRLDLELTLLFCRRRLSARLAVTNVLDARDADVVGFPLPGRSVHGSTEVSW